ncbi:MAG: LVIVD repeat-containing protein [Candidatus Thorarchaeota archaeon]
MMIANKRNIKTIILLLVIFSSFINFRFLLENQFSLAEPMFDDGMISNDSSDESFELLSQWDDNNFTAYEIYSLNNGTHSALIANQDHSLIYIDIVNSTTYSIIQTIHYNFSIYSLKIHNLIGYVHYNNSFFLIDFSNIFEPEIVSTYIFENINLDDVLFSENILYCFMYNYTSTTSINCSIQVFNISNIHSPVYLSTYNITHFVDLFYYSLHPIKLLTVESNFVYIFYYDKILEIVNFTSPSNPQFITYYEVEEGYLNPFDHMYVFNSNLYLMSKSGYYEHYENVIHVFNVTNFDNIYLICSFSKNYDLDSSFAFREFSNNFISEDLFIHISNEFTVYNISNPSSIIELSSYISVNKNIDLLTNIIIIDNLLYLCYKNGLEIVNLTDPLSPAFISYYSFGGYSWDVKVSSYFSFVADGYDGVEIFNCKDIRNPIKVSQFCNGGNYIKIIVNNDTIFALKEIDFYHYYIEVINITSITNPSFITSIKIDNISYYASNEESPDFVVENDRLYICYVCNHLNPPYQSVGYGITAFDISDLEQIQVLGSFHDMDTGGPFEYTTHFEAIQCTIKDSVIYLSNYNSDIEKISAGNPTYIHNMDTIDINESWVIDKIDYYNGNIYLAVRNQGLIRISLTYSNPQITFHYPLPPPHYYTSYMSIFVTKDYVFYSTPYDGLIAFNSTDSANITKIGQYNVDLYFSGITFTSNLLFISAYTRDLMIFHLIGLDYIWPPVSAENNIDTDNFWYLLILLIPIVVIFPIIFVIRNSNYKK